MNCCQRRWHVGSNTKTVFVVFFVLFLSSCGQQSEPCGCDKMYSDSRATVWAISPLIISLHLVCSDFIHLQIALRRPVSFEWGMNSTLCLCCHSAICFWWKGISKHGPPNNQFKLRSSCCYIAVGKEKYTWKCLSLNCVSKWKGRGSPFVSVSLPVVHFSAVVKQM